MAPRTIGQRELEGALPATSVALRLKGLDASVQIYRDAYGIPHIKSQSAHDAFFGQGFAVAQDRLWQMDRDRRRALGRWAELAGPAGVAEDRMLRRFQLSPSVRIDYDALNDETRAMLDAYASGVNAFIKSTESLPIEYALLECQPEPWEPWDCLAVFKVRHIFMGTYEAKLWRARLVNQLGPEGAAKLLRGYPQGHLVIIPPGATYDGPVADSLRELSVNLEAIGWLKSEDAGSNNWVLAGSRTASGKPLLAGDPHRALEVPNAYHQSHISCLEFDVIGLSFAGCPGFPHFGHNAHLAWCVTHAGADYQDLYVERFSKDDPAQYEFQGQLRQAEVRSETITVHGAAPVEMEVTVTHHGPVIAGDPGKGNGIAFRYTGTAEPNTTFEAIRAALTATTADELDAAMQPWVEPCQNLLYADLQGETGYLNRGRVPIRSTANGWLPVPGWTGKHEWQGSIPFQEMLRSRNPEAGYIVTANNRISGHDYPHYLSLDFAPAFRAQRITDRLAQLPEQATLEDMVSIHAERVSIPGLTYARLLSQVKPKNPLSASAQQRLAQWDGAMDPESVAATIYSSFRERLHRRLMSGLLGPLQKELYRDTTRGATVLFTQLATDFVHMAEADDTSLLPAGSGWSAVLSQALAEGVAYLKERLGGDMDSWRWGKVHFSRPQHPLSSLFPDRAPLLDPPSLPTGGDADTPQQGRYAPSDPFTMSATSVARYVYDLANWNNCAWIIPLGASGHPGSPHFADQAALWGQVKLVPMLYDWERIAAQAESRQRLEPR